MNIRLDKDTFYKVYLKVLNDHVELFIDGTKELDWLIPTNSDIKLHDEKKGFEDTIVPKIDFRKIYGRVGFRAYGNEGAIINELSIKRLPYFL